MLWQRFLANLTPGVRVVLTLWVAGGLAVVIGTMSHQFNPHLWLDLNGPRFWHGQIWRLITFPLLPMGVMDLIMNGVALVILGGMIERHWTRGQLWTYCFVAATGAGLAKVLLQSASPVPLCGATPVIFGLLIAWGFLSRPEPIRLFLLGETTVWKLVLIASAISFLTLFFTGGLMMALIMMAGGVIGFIFLWLKHQCLMNRRSSVVHSERIQRLEL